MSDLKRLRAETDRILTELSYELPPHIMRRLDRALAAERAAGEAERERGERALAALRRFADGDMPDGIWGVDLHDEACRVAEEDDRPADEAGDGLPAPTVDDYVEAFIRAALREEAPDA